ncbi:MAG: glycosyltransferase family 9 protein, partial [Planctomycetes bacterium]|nr:glycosyltransferase family 9 protein [Planctomycetota bacterium]
MSERILILRAGAVGDVVLGYPVLHGLRARDAGAHLCLAARTEARLLAVAAGLADTERDLSDAFFAPLFAPAERAPCRALADFVGSFDRVVSLLADPDGAIARRLRAHGAGELVSFAGLRPG